MKFQNDACLIANENKRPTDMRDFIYQSFVYAQEPILSDGTYRGLLNYAKVTVYDSSITEIQMALVSSKRR